MHKRYNLRKRSENIISERVIKKNKKKSVRANSHKNIVELDEKIQKLNKIDTVKMASLTASLDVILRALPNFDNSNDTVDITAFVNQFDKVVENADTSDEIRLILLRSKFSGAAKETILNTPELNNESDYKKFKDALINCFQKPKFFAQSQAQFMDIEQKPDQTIQQFVRIFNIAANKYISDSGHANSEGAKLFLETIKLNKFINSVRPEISYQLTIAEPKTFDEAVNIARKVESALNNSKETLTNMYTQNSQQNSAEVKIKNYEALCESLLNQTSKQEEDIKAMREALNNLQINKNENVNKANKYCHICKIENKHNTENCWFNSKNMANNTFGPFKPQTYRYPNMTNNMYPNQANYFPNQLGETNYTNTSQPRQLTEYTHYPTQTPQLMIEPNATMIRHNPENPGFTPIQNYQNSWGAMHPTTNQRQENNVFYQNSARNQNRNNTNFRNNRGRGQRNKRYNNSNYPKITFPSGN